MHFQAVSDRFSPHDAVLDFAGPDDLNDTAFRRKCSLPQAPNIESTHADMNDTEHETSVEDVGNVTTDKALNEQPNVQNDHVRVHKPKEGSQDKPTVPRPSTAKKQGASLELEKELEDLDNTLLGADLPSKKARPKSNDMMGMKAFLTEVTPPHTPGMPSQTAQTQDTRAYDFAPPPPMPRQSEDPPKTSYSLSSRTSTSDVWRNWKPKLKFGPRPVTEGKPLKTDQERQKMPAGYKAKHFKPDREHRPKSRKGEKVQTNGEGSRTSGVGSRPASKPEEGSKPRRHGPDVPPMPPLSTQIEHLKGAPNNASPSSPSPNALPQLPNSAKLTQATSGYSEGRDGRHRPAGLPIISKPPANLAPPGPKSAPALSPEKQRLMKALQIRKKHQHSAISDEPSPPTVGKSNSREPTPDFAGSVKNDSGIEVESNRARSDPDHSPPMMAPKAPMASPRSGRINPLTSHPILFPAPSPQPPRPHTNSPAPSSGSNKELPALPKEAREEAGGDALQNGHGEPHHQQQPSLSNDSALNDSSQAREENPVAHSALSTSNSELDHELEAAQVEQATALPAPARIHERNLSSPTATATTVTIKSSSHHDEISTIRNGTPDEFTSARQSSTPVQSHLNRHPSNSSRALSSHISDTRSALSSRRANMSSGISRRIQTLAQVSQNKKQKLNSHHMSAYDSAQAFLAPGALLGEEQRSDTSTAIGRAYEASRSASPRRSQGIRARASFDRERPNSQAVAGERTERQSQGPTGYRKRDSLTVTAHIMRPHQEQLQQLSALTPSINEEPEKSGDPQDALDALAGGRSFSPATEPAYLPPLSPPHHRLTFTRRDSAGSADTAKRPQSRGSVVSGLGRSSMDGWRSAFSAFGRDRRDSHSTGGRRESHSSSRPRPNVPRASTSQSHTPMLDSLIADSGGLDRVDEVSEPGTRASMTSRIMKRMSTLSPNPQASGAISVQVKPTVPENGHQKSGNSGFVKIRSEKLDSSKQTMNAVSGQSSVGRTTIVGDLNVQFPDTLLWKRRWVEIDTGGNLVLSPPKTVGKVAGGSTGGVRRFHLTEFKQPVVPSRDRQEKMHSVVLDFVEGGGTLQFAAEDRVQQGSLVKRKWFL